MRKTEETWKDMKWHKKTWRDKNMHAETRKAHSLVKMEVAKLFSNLKKIHLWNSWGFIFYVCHCYDYLSSVSSKLRDIYLRMDFHPGLQTHVTLWICRVWEIFGDMRRHQKTSRDMGRHEKHEETWKDMKNIRRHEKTWEKWKDMKRHEKTWKDKERH